MLLLCFLYRSDQAFPVSSDGFHAVIIQSQKRLCRIDESHHIPVQRIRIALSSPAFIASTVNPRFTSFLAGRLKGDVADCRCDMYGRILRTDRADHLCDHCDAIFRCTKHFDQRINMDPARIDIVLFRLPIILPNTSSLFSAVRGIPGVITQQCNYFPARISCHDRGTAHQFLSPSMDTELMIPGLLQHLYASLSTFALGLSTAIGRSVTLSTRPIIHSSVSTSTASSTDAHIDKCCACLCLFFAISLIHSSIRAGCFRHGWNGTIDLFTNNNHAG